MADGSPVPSPDDLEDQQFLFLGTVVSTAPIPTGDPLGDQAYMLGSSTVFHVEHAWRGARYYDTITVFSGFPGGGCGFVFKPGECYLVFASVEPDGMLRTSICTRTTPWSRAGGLIGYINAYLGPAWNTDPDLLAGY